jgi:hypothetical protein
MPTYIYQVIEADGSEGEIFEIMQSMSEATLTHHPDNGKAVRKLISAPHVAGKFGVMGAKADLSPKKLGDMGFTQYKKAGNGFYEKTAGSGPDVISKDGPV